MYGLTSRESLQKRQSRWVREVDEIVRSNPAQHAFNRDSQVNSVRDTQKPSIISMMTETSQDTEPISQQKISIHSKRDPHISSEPIGSLGSLGDSGVSLSTCQNLKLLRKGDLLSVKAPNVKSFNNHMMGIIPDNNEELSNIQTMYEDVRKKCSKLEQECELLRNDLSKVTQSEQDRLELIDRIQKLEKSQSQNELSARIQKLEQNQSFSNDVSVRVQRLEKASDLRSLVTRIVMLENTISELSSRTITDKPRATFAVLPIAAENSSEFSALTETDLQRKVPYNQVVKEVGLQNSSEIKEFVPYIIKEDYASIDNVTKLNGVKFEMTVEILGFYSETPIIYPFGTETVLPKFSDMTLEMSFKDADKAVNGTAYGLLRKRSDGVYTIQLTELYSDGNASGIEKYTLPLTFTCNTDLILE